MERNTLVIYRSTEFLIGDKIKVIGARTLVQGKFEGKVG